MWTVESHFAPQVTLVKLPNGVWINPAAVISVEESPRESGTVILTVIGHSTLCVRDTTIDDVISCLVQHDAWQPKDDA